MPKDRSTDMRELRDRLDRHEYVVDPTRVADALLARPDGRALLLAALSRPGGRSRAARGLPPRP
jgi:hypothetical protein